MLSYKGLINKQSNHRLGHLDCTEKRPSLDAPLLGDPLQPPDEGVLSIQSHSTHKTAARKKPKSNSCSKYHHRLGHLDCTEKRPSLDAPLLGDPLQPPDEGEFFLCNLILHT